MSRYEKQWPCCGDTSITDSYEPEQCPFCTPSAATLAAPGEVTDAQIEEAAERNKLFMAAAGYVFGVQDLRGFVNDIRTALSNPAPVAAPAQMAVNAIAALVPVELEGFPYAGRFRCQQCRFEWGGDLGSEGHATNCAYAIATSVAHTPIAAPAPASEALTLILLSTGEYSDYGVMGAFRPCKSFNVGEAMDAFKAQWKPEANSYSSAPGPTDFAAWLAKEGYVEDANTEEIHLGSYGDLDPSAESKALTFICPPPGDSADAPVQQAGEVPPPSGAERGLSDAEQRMLGFLFANMEDLSDKDWRDHGFRAATFNSLELKVRSTFMARRAALKGEQPAERKDGA